MLEAVKEKQVLLKLTNNAIAELFEIHEITWAKIKAGTIPLSAKMKAKAIEIWPDLIPLFLSENARRDSKKVA